jgi:hypothetical protein
MSKPEGHDEAVRRAAFLPGRIRAPPPFECFLPAPRLPLGRRIFVHVLLPIFASIYIYTLWGSPSFFVFKWYEELGLGSVIALFRRAAHPFRHLIPSFFLFSVPAALWLYAVTAICLLVWAGRKAKIKWLWIVLPFAFAAGSEIAQCFRIIPGTFDVFDLLAYGTAAIAAYTLLGKRMRNFSRR